MRVHGLPFQFNHTFFSRRGDRQVAVLFQGSRLKAVAYIHRFRCFQITLLRQVWMLEMVSCSILIRLRDSE
jgi:hypothetical protein